jgi:hypothetical protein
MTRSNARPAYHRGRGRERDYCADEGAERGKPEICLHVNYLKHSKIDISQGAKSFFPFVGADSTLCDRALLLITTQ